MPHLRYAGDELGHIGHELYENTLRAKVETQENIGKVIFIDIDTGDYEIGDDLIVTANRLLNKHKEAAIWSERIGYNAVYAVGGSLHRVKEWI